MKLKGVNPLEQHLEKIVLIGVSAAFLGVLAVQFLYEPNKVKLGAEMVPPGKAFEKAEAKARQLKGRMEAQEPPQLEDARAQLAKVNPNLTDEFRKRMNGEVAPKPPALATVGIGRKQDIDVQVRENGPVIGTAPIAPIAVPAPGEVAVAAFRGTIDPTETLTYPELKALLPAEQPFDKAWVTVEARFAGTALKQALAGTPDAGKLRPIPRQWWIDTTAICAVKLERQEQTAAGEWSAPAEVKPPPGGFDMASLLKNAQTTTDMEDVVNQANSYSDSIVRPAFYHVIAGPEWQPPSQMAAAPGAGPGANPEVDKQVRAYKAATDQEARLQKQRETVEKDTGREPPRQPGPGGGGGKGRGGGEGGAPQAPTRDPQKDKQDQLKKIDDQIKRAQDQAKAAQDKLKDLGFDEAGKRLKAGAPTNANPANPGNVAAAAKPLFETSDLQVWSHDLAVEPGKTYRYRVSIAIDNPAFARATALVDEQKALATSPLAWSQPSEWSTPVMVPADRYYFITGTAEPDVAGPAHATAEVYQFFYGYYRRGTATLEPGDIVSAQLHLPDSGKLPIFDLTAVPDPNKPEGQQPVPGNPGGPAQPPPDRGDPRTPGKGSQPGKTGQPGGTPKGQPPGRGGIEPIAQGQAAAKPTLPQNARPWSKTITAAVDAVLLDVARPTAGGEGSKADALIRVADGTIQARDPDEDRANELYKQVSASAKEGENQAVPGSEPAKPAGPAAPTGPTGPKQPPKPPKQPGSPPSRDGPSGGG